MNRILMEALLDCLLFLELSGDEVIDPDAAVRQMESVGFLLNQLSKEQRDEFIRFAQQQALITEGGTRQSERAEFLASIRENLGLIE